MSVTAENGTGFRTAIMGYHKAEVDGYVTRTREELETHEKSRKESEQKIQDLNAEIQRLTAELETERSEKQELAWKHSCLTVDLENLKQQLQDTENKYEALKNEYHDFRERTEAEGTDPKIIQDAILNAQRMSDIVIVEAQKKALEIRETARKERKEQEEEGRLIVETARTEAQRLTGEAQSKCVNLQREYDRILLDVTGFKAELMKMYRKHMELLAALPQKAIEEMDDKTEVIEVNEV